MDRRIDKTKKVLKETLVSLMEEKELRKITISEITTRANVNRGTFYLHYLDIYDMVEKLGDEIIDKIKEIVDSNNPLAMNYLYLPVLVKIVEYFYQDQQFIRAMISPNGDPFFLGRIQKIMIEHTMKLYKKDFKYYDENYVRVIMTFIVSGGVGVFTEWFKGGCKTPIHEVIAPCEAIISKGMNNL
jgi:AcrR family transcriptional regulator